MYFFEIYPISMTEVTEHECTVSGLATVEADTQDNLRLPWELELGWISKNGNH